MKTNLIIPMAGMGYRFVKEGYKIYKPFLKYNNGNTILEGIINNGKRIYCSYCERG